MALVYNEKDEVNREQVNKQAVKIFKGENRFETGAHQRLSPVGCVKAMWRYATRSASKQKRRLLQCPGY